jgi:hypothetical protein
MCITPATVNLLSGVTVPIPTLAVISAGKIFEPDLFHVEVLAVPKALVKLASFQPVAAYSVD